MEKDYDFHYTTQWEGIQLDAFLKLDYFKGMSQVSFYSKNQVPTPISQTGFRNEWVSTEVFKTDWKSSLEDLTESYLEEKSKSKDWLTYCKNRKVREERAKIETLNKTQLKLF